jgi:hypothetical protein
VNSSGLFRAADSMNDIRLLAFFMRSWTSLQSCSYAKVALPNSSMGAVVVLPFCSSSPPPNPSSQTDQAAIVAGGATAAGASAAPPLLHLLL